MAQKRATKDALVRTIEKKLREEYGSSHPAARIDVYRHNSASIRVRIVDPDFRGMDLVEREEKVWPIIEGLPEETRSEITVLLLITPREKRTSIMSREFDEPMPSRL